MFVSYPMNPLLVRRCPVMSVSSELSFENVQNFPPDKTDRNARLMYGHCVAYTLHKSIARVWSVRGDELCHRITKFCMFCPFFLRYKSVCRSDQALNYVNKRLEWALQTVENLPQAKSFNSSQPAQSAQADLN